MQKLEVHSLRGDQSGQLKYWHFVFTSGWATFTVNEDTGSFSIESDWGNYSHRWPIDATGEPSMVAFIASCHSEYILRKFAYDQHRGFKSQFDIDRTLQGFRERVIECRKDEQLTKKEARQCWEELDEVFERIANYGHEQGPTILWDHFPEFVASKCDISDLHEWFHYKPSQRYGFLEDVLVPFFPDHIRNMLKVQAQLLKVQAQVTCEPS